jgi:hypothetical protein
MAKLLGTVRTLCLEILLGAMWLVLIVGVFVVSVGVVATLPYSEAKLAAAVLSLASIAAFAKTLFKLKVASEKPGSKFAPLVRDLCFAAAVMLASIFGNLPSGGCYSYYGADRISQFVDCGYGPIPIDRANQGF